jgi:CRP/FNR family transcriptional regulator
MTNGADCAHCAIRHRGFCGLLDDRTQSTVAGCKRMLTLPANKLLWDDEQSLGFIGVLQSGYLRFQRYGMDGRRQILCVLKPGDIIGDPQDQARGYSVETATSVRICKFSERQFDRLPKDLPEVARAVYRMRSARLDELRWLTWSLGMLSAEERFCAFLATATTHMPFEPDGQQGGTLTIELPRRDIADLLATSVETISRNCQKLALEGVINIIGPRLFRIPDTQRLAERGCLKDLSGRGRVVRNSVPRSVRTGMQDRIMQLG